MSKLNTRTSGFTLVELSIVIIIIGFLIAGISAGTSMIKSAELNAIVTDFQSYQSSYNNFVGRYSQAPGDFNNGTAIWGTNCATTAGDCNGNANGIIDTNREIQTAWKQLALASMISANIAIVPNSLVASAIGTNVPPSKTLGAGYSLVNGSTSTVGLSGGVLWGATTLTNAVLIGKATGTAPSALGDAVLQNSALVAQQAYSIDKKIDDGVGYSGTVRAADGLDAVATNCVAAGATGDYALAITATSCVLAMQVN